jgi:hypothetical protein
MAIRMELDYQALPDRHAEMPQLGNLCRGQHRDNFPFMPQALAMNRARD